jgi:hypothetical protein
VSKKVRQALIRKIRTGLHRPFHGNNPVADKDDLIKWLSLKPGTDIEYMFRHGYMIVSYYKSAEQQWYYKLTGAESTHNIIAEVMESEL